MTHTHAEVLRAIADGVPLSEFEVLCIDWCTGIFKPMDEGWKGWIDDPDFWEIRRKQRTHVVNGFTVPAPMDKDPGYDDTYFVLDLADEVFHSEWKWRNFQSENQWLKRGLCFATRETAIANAKAMLKIDPEAA